MSDSDTNSPWWQAISRRRLLKVSGAGLAAGLYRLLVKQPGFTAGLLQLQPLPQGSPGAWSAAQQKTASDVLSAWYLGKVGEGAEAQVVSYEKALMFDAVAGVLVIRSYCSGKPGYWAAQPAATA